MFQPKLIQVFQINNMLFISRVLVEAEFTSMIRAENAEQCLECEAMLRMRSNADCTEQC